MKKILVGSFPRSGTHFLINSLGTNFESVDDGWIDVVQGKNNKMVREVTKKNLIPKIREQLVDVYFPAKPRKCVKTHYQMYFFERYLDEIKEKYDILYIVRDPRDVMVACHNFYNQTNYSRFIKEPDFGKFLRTELWDVPTETQPFSFSYVKPRNIIDKWHKHILSWLPYKDKGVTFVRFADLKRDYEGALKLIERKTSQKLKGHVVEVTVEDTRYRPDFNLPDIQRGQVGSWQGVFSADDLSFLNDHISTDVWKLFEGHDS